MTFLSMEVHVWSLTPEKNISDWCMLVSFWWNLSCSNIAPIRRARQYRNGWLCSGSVFGVEHESWYL